MSNSPDLYRFQAKLLKALAHPARLEVLHILWQQPLTVREMQDMTALPQAKLSQHLQILRTEQIVMAVRNGKHIKYRLTHPDFLRAADLVRAILSQRHQTRSLSPTRRDKTFKAATAIDPVCNMTIHPATAAYADAYKGTMQYFCGRGCLLKFQRHAEQYVRHR